jgi:hypothetical protein
MKRFIPVFLMFFLLTSCITQQVGLTQKERELWNKPPDLTKVVYTGGDGITIEKAIVIKEAGNERNGVAAEYDFIAKKYGVKFVDWKPGVQSTFEEKGKRYDSVNIQTIPKNETIRFYFDITDFYGKW